MLSPVRIRGKAHLHRLDDAVDVKLEIFRQGDRQILREAMLVCPTQVRYYYFIDAAMKAEKAQDSSRRSAGYQRVFGPVFRVVIHKRTQIAAAELRYPLFALYILSNFIDETRCAEIAEGVDMATLGQLQCPRQMRSRLVSEICDRLLDQITPLVEDFLQLVLSA